MIAEGVFERHPAFAAKILAHDAHARAEADPLIGDAIPGFAECFEGGAHLVRAGAVFEAPDFNAEAQRTQRNAEK